jgi:RNA polymerase sigma-70 factor (ECF subfamily)
LHQNVFSFSFSSTLNDMTDNLTQFDVTEETGSDMDLVHASKNGDAAAFEQLVKRYDRKLLRIAQSITHNREDSQDAVQEAFLKAYQNLSAFREDSKFSTWLFRITVNQSLMKLRRQRTTREASLDEDFQADGDVLPKEVTDWAPNPEQLYWASELRDILIKCLEQLSPILRTVFVLRDIEGLTIDQTVEVLNVSETAVKARLLRARLQLREGLNKYFSKQTHLARAKLFPSGGQTGRILGLFAECLRNAMERTHSINLAESQVHAALVRQPTVSSIASTMRDS